MYHDTVSLEELNNLELALQANFARLRDEQRAIEKVLSAHADSKRLKGNELVGWLGEIYGKLIIGGELVDDTFEHDFVSNEGWLVSVKARRGEGSSWTQTGLIPKIDGEGCPTHLLFVKIGEDYRAERAWLYPWNELFQAGRFKQKYVRKEDHPERGERGFIFRVRPKMDEPYLTYMRVTTAMGTPIPIRHDANLKNRCLLTGEPCKGTFAGLGTDAKARSLVVEHLAARRGLSIGPMYNGLQFVPSEQLLSYARLHWGIGEDT